MRRTVRASGPGVGVSMQLVVCLAAHGGSEWGWWATVVIKMVVTWDMVAELQHGHMPYSVWLRAACRKMQAGIMDALTIRRSDLCVQSQRYCLQLLKRRKQVPLW